MITLVRADVRYLTFIRIIILLSIELNQDKENNKDPRYHASNKALIKYFSFSFILSF